MDAVGASPTSPFQAGAPAPLSPSPHTPTPTPCNCSEYQLLISYNCLLLIPAPLSQLPLANGSHLLGGLHPTTAPSSCPLPPSLAACSQ